MALAHEAAKRIAKGFVKTASAISMKKYSGDAYIFPKSKIKTPSHLDYRRPKIKRAKEPANKKDNFPT